MILIIHYIQYIYSIYIYSIYIYSIYIVYIYTYMYIYTHNIVEIWRPSKSFKKCRCMQVHSVNLVMIANQGL